MSDTPREETTLCGVCERERAKSPQGVGRPGTPIGTICFEGVNGLQDSTCRRIGYERLLRLLREGEAAKEQLLKERDEARAGNDTIGVRIQSEKIAAMKDRDAWREATQAEHARADAAESRAAALEAEVERLREWIGGWLHTRLTDWRDYGPKPGLGSWCSSCQRYTGGKSHADGCPIPAALKALGMSEDAFFAAPAKDAGGQRAAADRCPACGNSGLSMERLNGACHALECPDPLAWLRARDPARAAKTPLPPMGRCGEHDALHPETPDCSGWHEPRAATPAPASPTPGGSVWSRVETASLGADWSFPAPTQGETRPVADTSDAVIERWSSNGPIAAPSPETAAMREALRIALGVIDDIPGRIPDWAVQRLAPARAALSPEKPAAQPETCCSNATFMGRKWMYCEHHPEWKQPSAEGTPETATALGLCDQPCMLNTPHVRSSVCINWRATGAPKVGE